ncbi:MAG: FAD-dependent monooxygenase [Exilibacterium sp.]
MALGDGDFCARLSLAFEHCLGEITTCAERFCLPLRQRHAISYVQAGIALVGDAAHTIHPLAGQGVNLGFLDAEALVEEIQRALLRQLPLSEYSILRRYQRRRMGDNLGMMGAMESFKRMFGSRDPFVRWLRNTGMRELDKLPLLKNIAVKKAIG